MSGREENLKNWLLSLYISLYSYIGRILNMSISFSTKKKPEEKKQEDVSTQTPLLATIKQMVGLKFSNGYEFTVSYENGKMIIAATMNGQEAFYLDEIPEEFVENLKRMLK